MKITLNMCNESYGFPSKNKQTNKQTKTKQNQTQKQKQKQNKRNNKEKTKEKKNKETKKHTKKMAFILECKLKGRNTIQNLNSNIFEKKEK